jgi:hypothetical protein
VSGEKWIVWRERADAKGVGERAVSGESVNARGEESMWEVAGREGVVGAWSCSSVPASMFAVEGRDLRR